MEVTSLYDASHRREEALMKRTVKLAMAMLVVGAAAQPRAQDYRAYQNYDFVAGDRIIFEDDFRGDQDGEFAAHWRLISGQAVVNKIDGEPALLLTEGNYAVVAPRIRGDAYLSAEFTVEM